MENGHGFIYHAYNKARLRTYLESVSELAGRMIVRMKLRMLMFLFKAVPVLVSERFSFDFHAYWYLFFLTYSINRSISVIYTSLGTLNVLEFRGYTFQISASLSFVLNFLGSPGYPRSFRYI